jgi:hypothetical protein
VNGGQEKKKKNLELAELEFGTGKVKELRLRF